MKTLIAATLLLAAAGGALADNYHRGYVKQDGTYVAPHYQSAPDNSRYNNYSTQGNTNPYTGQAGTREATPTYRESTSPYSGSSGGYTSNYGQQPRRTGY